MEIEKEHLPFEVDESRWGVLVHATQCCPGVYYLAAKPENQLICNEYYAVVENYEGSVISKETFSYGILSNGAYYFEKNSGWSLVEFELVRYQTKYGRTVSGGPYDDLYCTAVYATELYPEYFGAYIPPRLTPHGQTMRYKTVTNGIYFLETDLCIWLLAICYPIWNTELSEFSLHQGEFCKETQAIAGEEFNYLFFTTKRCTTVIYELCHADKVYFEGFKPFLSSSEALIAAMWETCPEYIIFHNYMEQTRRVHWLLSLLDFELEEKEEKEAPFPNCIVYHPNISGKFYLLLP